MPFDVTIPDRPTADRPTADRPRYRVVDPLGAVSLPGERPLEKERGVGADRNVGP
jgi:hypothetical protein